MLPSDKQHASLQPGGFYRTTAVPYTIITDAHQSFRLTGGTITLDGVTVGLTSDFRYFAVPLNPAGDDVSLTGDQLELSGGHLHGTATVGVKTENGRQTRYPT